MRFRSAAPPSSVKFQPAGVRTAWPSASAASQKASGAIASATASETAESVIQPATVTIRPP